MVAHIDIALIVKLIGVGGEHGVHVERIVLPPLQAQVDVHIAPRAHLGGGVVAHVDVERIDEANLLDTVVLVLPLHLQVVAQGEADVAALALARHAVEQVLIGRIAHKRHVTVGIGLLVSVPVAVAGGTEVWRITEAHSRRDDVADSLNPVAEYLAVRRPETINLGRETHAHVPVVHVVESVGGIANLFLGGCVPRLRNLVGIHAVGEVERWRHVQVLEERERGADRYLVLPSVAPVLDERAVHQLVLLGVDAVGDVSGVAHRNLLVPLLVAHRLLSSERIEAGDGNVEVWQGHRNRRVAHVLREVGGRAERHADAGERGAPTDG